MFRNTSKGIPSKSVRKIEVCGHDIPILDSHIVRIGLEKSIIRSVDSKSISLIVNSRRKSVRSGVNGLSS